MDFNVFKLALFVAKITIIMVFQYNESKNASIFLKRFLYKI
jgi:hypothetical protein